MGSVIREKKIIIYGAGYCGIMLAELLKEHGMIAECFFDKNIEKTGLIYEGIKVEMPHAMKKQEDYIIIVAILQEGKVYTQIKDYLFALGFSHIIHINELQDEKDIFLRQQLIICPKKDLVEKNKERYTRLFEALGNQESRDTLRAIWNVLTKSNAFDAPAYPIDQQYFAYDVYKNIPNEVIIDCGACKGEEIQNYKKWSKFPWKYYYAVEADKAYRSYLSEESLYDRNIEIKCPLAVSNVRETLFIKNYGNMNSVIKENCGEKVQAETLDNLFQNVPVTFLKLDIEGYEIKALKGARKMIETYMPVIAVAAYHYETEFYEIYEYISSISKEYHFYLRSYMNVHETILYAVPSNRLLEE